MLAGASRVFAESRLILTEAKAPQPTPEHDNAPQGLPLMIVQPSRRVQRSSLSA
jgi:hypothetical protein